jgi:hypothetical protein
MRLRYTERKGSFALPFLFDDCHGMKLKEVSMRKYFSILCLLFAGAGLNACAHAPGKQVYTPDQQRSHAQDAQGELSSEIHK